MFFLLLVLIVLYFIYKFVSSSPEHIGAIGESRVARELNKLDDNKYIGNRQFHPILHSV